MNIDIKNYQNSPIYLFLYERQIFDPNYLEII